MNKVNEIRTSSTLEVQVNCSLNEDVLANNFSIILQCLKEIGDRQSILQKQCSNIKTTSNDYSILANDVTMLKNNHTETQKQILNLKNIISTFKPNQQSNLSTNNSNQQLHKQIQAIKQKIDKDQKNIMQNIKDINIINKNITQLSNIISQLTHSQNQKQNNIDSQKQKITNDQTFNIKFNQLKMEILSINNNVAQHATKIIDIKKIIDQMHNTMNLNQKDSHNADNNSFDSLKNRTDIISTKINNMAEKINQNTKNIEILNQDTKSITKEIQEIKQNLQKIDNLTEHLNKQLSNRNNNQFQNQFKNLKNQLTKLKKAVSDLNHMQEKKKLNTSIDDNLEDSKYLNQKQGLYTHSKFMNRQDDYKQLRQRIQALQKVTNINGKSLHTEEKSNPEKLPTLKKLRVLRQGGEKSSMISNKKQLGQFKAEIQTWVKSYLDNSRDKNNIQDIQIKIQQIKNMINKKADYEGVKKGLTFLENKISQLYMFLTEPNTEDAMIARKGFNCLSCSKKVQKLRGRLGPHINWNNMTVTNYTPPKIGYSKPQNLDKEIQL